MISVVIRVDADHSIGLGHAVRCAALAEALTEASGGGVAVTVVGAGTVLPGLFPGGQVLAIAADDDDAFARILAEREPAAVVIDHPHRVGSWVRRVRQTRPDAAVVVIDDEGGERDADLVINGTVPDAYHHYSGLPERARMLLGPCYTLLRPAFGRVSWSPPPADSADAGVVMVVGSGARATRWVTFLLSKAVDRSGWGARPRLVVGAAFPEPAALAKACDAAGLSLAVGLGAVDLASALVSASVALITGGMIVCEALAVGVPMVVYPQEANLVPEARWLAARGCLIDLGAEGGFQALAVQAAVAALRGDRDRAEAMSRCQRRLMDGRGAERVAVALLAICGASSSYNA